MNCNLMIETNTDLLPIATRMTDYVNEFVEQSYWYIILNQSTEDRHRTPYGIIDTGLHSFR